MIRNDVPEVEPYWGKTRRQKRPKYNNKKTIIGNITFDSEAEARRYLKLKKMLMNGEIRNLKLQPEFTLQEAYMTSDGKKVKAIKYKADFSYEALGKAVDPHVWLPVVEDVKGVKTKEYQLKKKMMLEKFGIWIEEIDAKQR